MERLKQLLAEASEVANETGSYGILETLTELLEILEAAE
jgi:hypothetical protein